MDKENYNICKKIMITSILGTDMIYHFNNIDKIKELSKRFLLKKTFDNHDKFDQ